MTVLDDRPDGLSTLYAAQIITAWYTALNLHFAEHGSITLEDRIAILTRVHSQVQEFRSYLETQDRQPGPTRDLMEKFKGIALFSARSAAADPSGG